MSSQIDQTIPDIFPFVKKGLRLANHNINSLVNKLDQLKWFLDCDTPPLDIYCINETFLTSSTDDSYLNINGYFLLRKDRIHKIGGGVVMYIRNGIHFKRRPDLEKTTYEMITIEIKCSNKSILLSTVCRPLDNDNNACQQWLLDMEESLYKINSENKQIVLTGDINIDLLSDK